MIELDTTPITFESFLAEAVAKGGFHNDDIAAITLPLFEEVLTFHEASKAAPLENLQHILITNDKLDIDENFIRPIRTNEGALKKITVFHSATFDITEEKKVTEVITDNGAYSENTDTVALDLSKPITRPVYLLGYHNYEHKFNHHDELSDIFSLGMILASVSLGLNFNNEQDLKAFAEDRTRLLYLNNKLHPAIANLIVEMTELFRHRRARDLYDIIERLKNFRNYSPERQYDLSVVHGFQKQDISSKQKWVLSKLKSRLFDMSRRNRLLYFKPNLRFVNLTAASVPNVVNVSNIKPESLFTWNADLASKISAANDISLTKYLRFEDNPYLPAYLDKLRSEAERDRKEYGFTQLRLAVCFLNWYNFKEDKNERIQTPLVLVPVQLIKKKGVKDQYVLQPKDTEAEVNPVLVYLLREIYGLQLPDKIDLAVTNLHTLFEELQKQITSNNSGIQLELIEKPRIRIIHTLAKQVLSQYSRRLRNKNTHFEHHKNLDYSYQSENYQPLGLQLFKKYVEPRASFLQWLIDENVSMAPNYFKGDEKERTFITVGDETSNPFRWDFDLCNVVLGNFNYKKMSLVSDYNTIADNNISSSVFEEIFSDAPKKVFSTNSKAELQNQFPIVIADPTQTNAISFSHHQKSYIIQGPPGTGKSQTITNLIADFVARGMKVLFVCEKRAALDVVYFRLKQQGLDELCCLIHDSQGDKKQFIQELKGTYEKYLKENVDVTVAEQERNTLLAEIDTQIKLLEQYDEGLSSVYEHTGVSLRQLIHRLIELKNSHQQLNAAEMELLPDFKLWSQFGKLVGKLNEAVKQNSSVTSWAAHPLSTLNKNVFDQELPVNYLNTHIKNLKQLLSEIETEISSHHLPDGANQNFDRLVTLIKNVSSLKPLALSGNVQLLDKNSSRYFSFKQSLSDLKQLQEEYAATQKKNSNWLTRIAENDVAAAREMIEKHEGKFFSFLNGEFRRLKKLLNESYNFSAHSVKPSMRQVLTDLEKEYQALEMQNKLEKNMRDTFQLENIPSTQLLLETISNYNSKNYFNHFINQPDGNEAVLNLARHSQKITDASELLEQMLHRENSTDLKSLNILLDEILKSSNTLPQIMALLKDLKQSPENFLAYINKQPLSTEALEATLAYGNLLKTYNQRKELEATDANTIQLALEKLQSLHKKWLRCNAQVILARQHTNFKKAVQRSEASMAGQPGAEKEWKRSYTDGRKILENEFGKQMRYKAIRELATGNSGQVIKDLKPVWLMSPLSVSDTLPVHANFFDVVIFDEASQITLEEGIPPVFRATQSIIVGDEMQMPPTNFFGTTTQDPDDVFDDPENETVTLDADSLLIQAARKLPDVMLGWHYRSRYESLISFSNNAFYKAGLLTIPDRTASKKGLEEIIVSKAEEADANTSKLFDRSISYHHLPNSVYEFRTNVSEAKYIARLVLSLLKQQCKESIGVVAFSQEQQTQIENALEVLAEEWKMTTQLEEAYQRVEDDQFVGLFVKNLENVQGDERDIIIMSVCYGYDSHRKMLMNFGPINRKGGEKRLNVIFSRAKKHMAVVASIQYTDIKNEYNEGANYFRRFLQYAFLVSSGRNNEAATILQTLSNQTRESVQIKNIIVEEIAAWLNLNGFIADTHLGQSYFKCQLAVRRKVEDEFFCLGILVDSDEPGADVIEKYFQRPSTMQAFGWNVMQVWVKDWLHKQDDVRREILKQLK